MDKLTLVPPVLGLYAELYACGKRDSIAPFFTHVLQYVKKSEDEILPKSFTPHATKRDYQASSKAKKLNKMSTVGSAVMKGSESAAKSTASFANKFQAIQNINDATRRAARAMGRANGELELFGSLVRAVEELVDEQQELRLELRKSVQQRRDNMQHKRQNLKAVVQATITSGFNLFSASQAGREGQPVVV